MKWLILPFQVGQEDQGMWLIPAVKANSPEECFSSMVLCLHQAFPFSTWYLGHECLSVTSWITANSGLLKIKQLHEAKLSLEHPTLEAELWQGDTPNSWWGWWTWHVPLRLLVAVRRAGRLPLDVLRKFSVQKVVFAEAWTCQIRNQWWPSVSERSSGTFY